MTIETASTLTNAEVDLIRQKLHRIVWPMVSDKCGGSPSFNWELRAGTSKDTTGLIYKADHPQMGSICKIELILDVTVDQFQQKFTNEKELEWCPCLRDFYTLETAVDKSWDVSYNVTSIGFGFTNRDFVNLNLHKKLENGCLYDITVAYPKSHPKDPIDCKTVRGEYLPSVILVRPLPNSRQVEYVFVNNFDLKGFLPKRIVNMFTSTFMINYGKAFIAKCKSLQKD